MTPEILKLYDKLQKLFGEKMGALLDRDFGYCPITKDIEDPLGCRFTCSCADRCESAKVLLRLPLPIDPVNPERGLWGMVDWAMFFPQIGRDGGLRISREGFDTDWCVPEIALLKTLIRQEGL